MIENKVILIVHAHPDDTEAFCAGSLAYLKEAGWTIHIATMTAGGMGGIGSNEADTILTRKKEAHKAAEVIDAEYHCLDQRDGFVFDTTEARVAVTSLIRKTGAEILMTHLPFDYHSDHRTTCNIVEAAAMMTTLPNHPSPEKPLEKTPVLYHTAPLGFSDTLGNNTAPPHFFIDISPMIDIKMKMLSHHNSQIELMRVMHKIDDFFGEMKSYNEDLGKLVGVPFAEIYWQHLGGGFSTAPLLQDVLKEKIIFKEKQ